MCIVQLSLMTCVEKMITSHITYADERAKVVMAPYTHEEWQKTSLYKLLMSLSIVVKMPFGQLVNI